MELRRVRDPLVVHRRPPMRVPHPRRAPKPLHAYEPASFRLRELSELFEDVRNRAESLIQRARAWDTEVQ